MNLFWNQCRRSENQPSTFCGLGHNLWANGPKRRASREDTSHRCPGNGAPLHSHHRLHNSGPVVRPPSPPHWWRCERTCLSVFSEPYSLNLVEGYPVTGSVVQPRSLGRLVSGDGARVLEGASVGEVVGDSGGTEAMTVDRVRQPGPPGASPHHLEHDLPVHARALEPGLRDVHSLEQRSFRRIPEPCGVHVLAKVLDEPVVRGDLVLLSALLVEKEHALVVAEPVVLDVHADDRADAPEGVQHGADERAVAEAASVWMRTESSSVRAWSSLRTGVFPTLTTCFGLWTDVAGLDSRVPPETIQSKHLLIAERCCLTEALERGICST